MHRQVAHRRFLAARTGSTAFASFGSAIQAGEPLAAHRTLKLPVAAEAALAQDKAKIAEDRRALEQETGRLAAQLEGVGRERAEVVGQVSPPALATYDTLMKARKSLAVVEARDGLCTACHVRVRPQVFNEIRRGNTIHQCGSCHRILYFVQAAGQAAEGPASETGQ